ncbi:DsbA family protein [Gemmatimonas sp.]|uniref:DsbA family protein n=1 Tax=Gemmatimonas sp. TaxID=1962908 RepID=UPI003982F912
MSARWKGTVDTVLVLSALLAAVSLAYRTFARPLVRRTATERQEPARRLTPQARPFLLASRLGEVTAPDTLLIFSDYQCPACKRFERLLSDYAQMSRSKLTIGYLHFPLPTHPQAVRAANLAECANILGRFSLAHHVLFEAQDTLSRINVAEIAKRMRPVDSVAFIDCAEQSDTSAAVVESIELARRLSVRATPTLIVNGWLTGVPSDARELAEWIRRSRRGIAPY